MSQHGIHCNCGRFARVLLYRTGVYVGYDVVDIATVQCSRCGESTVTL